MEMKGFASFKIALMLLRIEDKLKAWNKEAFGIES